MKLNTQSKRANYVCYVFRSTEILKFVTSLVQFATDHTTAAVWYLQISTNSAPKPGQCEIKVLIIYKYILL